MATSVCFSRKFEASTNKVNHLPQVQSTTWWISCFLQWPCELSVLQLKKIHTGKMQMKR